MARVLNGRELADFIKERQARQVRNLRQEHRVTPCLCIIQSDQASPVIETYVRMKRAYAQDILIDVRIVRCGANQMKEAIRAANDDPAVHGIIVQLPIDIPEMTDEVVSLIASDKDVDGLGESSLFISATAEAIDWLLNGYNISLNDKRIALIGKGRLIGRPLEALWGSRDLMVRSFDRSDFDTEYIRAADIIVTATGSPKSLGNELVKHGAVVVDAGTASDEETVVGDIAPSLRERSDVTMTPEKGGVGPLTVAVMFDHVIQAAMRRVGKL